RRNRGTRGRTLQVRRPVGRVLWTRHLLLTLLPGPRTRPTSSELRQRAAIRSPRTPQERRDRTRRVLRCADASGLLRVFCGDVVYCWVPTAVGQPLSIGFA